VLNTWKARSIVGGILLLMLVILLVKTVDYVAVEANEISVIEQRNWFGVGATAFDWKGPGTYYLIPGWRYSHKEYFVGTQKLTFQSARVLRRSQEGSQRQEIVAGEYPSIDFKVGGDGGQEVETDVTLNYRVGWAMADSAAAKKRGIAVGEIYFDPQAVIRLHQDLKDNYRDVVLKRRTRDIVINHGTTYTSALDIYSGDGFGDFKMQVARSLTTDPGLNSRGILIEDAIVYRNNLDPDYGEEIRLKALKIQEALRKKEETKAAEEEAKRVFAEAQAEVEKRTQTAEASKIERIKAAEADAEERRLEGQGLRMKKEEEAKGVLALGLAEAEVEEAKRNAKYDGTSGYRRAMVELESNRAEKYRGMLDGMSVINDKTILQVLQDANKSVKLTTPVGDVGD